MPSTDLFKNSDLRLQVYKIFNKSENEVNEDVEIIKKWLETQPHLPEIMQNSHIIKFLVWNKFSIEKTKQKIDMYYTIRSLIPDFYDKINPKLPNFKKCLEFCNILIHPKLFEGLHRIYMYKLLEPNALMPLELMMSTFNINEIRLHEDHGYKDVHIIDLINGSITDFAKFTPTLLQKGITIYEKVYSLPIRAIYLINAPPYVSGLVAILKSLLKPKIFQRVHVSEDDAILKKIFTIDELPKDYGGKGPSLKNLAGILQEKFDEYQNRFDLLDKLRVDENLRPEALINDELLGFHGNFKKLNFTAFKNWMWGQGVVALIRFT